MTVRGRRRTFLRGVVAVVAVVAVGAVGVAVLAATGVLQPRVLVALAAPKYVDDTPGSGLDMTYDGPFEFAVGGGVAVFDCDDDGRPDLYVAGGAGAARLYHDDSDIGGGLRFSRRADPATDLTDVTGAYPVDVDGDGRTDIMVLRNGENVALRGLGDCRFERANEAWGLAGGSAQTAAFSATWEGGAHWPTVAFGNYVDPDSQDPQTWCQPNELIRPNDARTGFGSPLPLTPSWCTLSMLFSDWDGSGRMDLRVSNDRHYYPAESGEEQLWRIEPGQPPRLYTDADGWVLLQIEGMGIASHDLTGDGLPEVYLTSQAANRLQSLSAGPSQPTYLDIGFKRGVTVATPFMGDTAMASTAWHPEFADINNDGLVDLFVSKGNVSTQGDAAHKDPSNLLIGHPDGTFTESADRSGILSFDRGRGAALADFNLDGRLDLVEVFYGAPARIWRNDGPLDGSIEPAHWLALRLRQAGANRDAIGATIEVTLGGIVLRREVTVGGGHAGGQLGWSHFGLGPFDRAGVRVRWPDGQRSDDVTLAADGFTIIDRELGIVPWQPGS